MAEYNLSKWLRDDLGQKHMSEVDMNNLVYHPRHGSLCRRLIKFWTESTLCTRKYPNFEANEECKEAEREFKQQEELSSGLLLKLESRARINGNTRNELNYLIDQHKCLVSIEDMLKTNTEALESVVGRPNFNIIQMGRQLEDPKYLGDLSLEELCRSAYHIVDPQQQPDQVAQIKLQSESVITRRDMATANEEYEKLEIRAQVMHEALTRVLADVGEQVEQSEHEIKQMQSWLLERTNVQQLEALKVPECQQDQQQVIEIEADPEERQLREERERLVRDLTGCNQQVNELAKQYTSAKGKLNESYKQQLGKDLALLMSLHQKEAVLRDATGRGGGGGGEKMTAT